MRDNIIFGLFALLGFVITTTTLIYLVDNSAKDRLQKCVERGGNLVIRTDTGTQCIKMEIK